MFKKNVKIIFFLFCFFLFPKFCLASSDIVFNEICWMGDENSSSNEWIELKNNTDKDIELLGWVIESQDGSPIIDLEGTIPAEGIFLLERTDDDSSPVTADMFYTGALGNDGEDLKLKNTDGNLIDEINFIDGWPAGDNNTKQTMERGKNDWQTSLNVGGTPGKENSLGSFSNDSNDEEGEHIEDWYFVSDDIFVPDQLITEELKEYEMVIISEVFPDPWGDDRQGEFIELKNIGDKSINLKDWSIQESDGRKYTIQNSIWLKPGRQFVVYRDESGLILDNDGDQVLLFSPDRKIAVDKISYGDYDMAWSYALSAEGDWVWTKQPTPGFDNIIIKKNLPPKIVSYIPEEIIVGKTVWFEASDSIDPENDKLEFIWDFGDGTKVDLASPSHIYLNPGEYTVILTITDGINVVSQEKKVFVFSNSGEKMSGEKIFRGIVKVVINEALPNPVGRDSDGEYIEIKNIGKDEIDIFGWSIDDEDGGSNPYVFNNHINLSPGLILLLPRNETNIALNNEGDRIKLLDNLGDIVFETEYNFAPEGQSWARGENGNFFWTENPSPGLENKIKISEKIYNPIETKKEKIEYNNQKENFRQSSLVELKNFSIGDKIRILGTVAVEPGILSSQYFYITGSPGLQVYNYYKDFPELSLGDMIEVKGEISKINNEKRLKTKKAEDIVILYHDNPPDAIQVLAEEFNDIEYGELISVAGQVAEKQDSHIYLNDDTGEINIYIKPSTGINTDFIEEGDNLSVVGLVVGSSSGKIIMPRYSDDIQKINKTGEIQNNDSPLAGINIAEAKSDLVLPARNAKKEFLNHVLILLFGVLTIFCIWKWRQIKN